MQTISSQRTITGKETVFFPKPEKDPTPPVASKPDESKLVDIEIDKGDLIANGRDSTFLTISLKTCSGNAISYEDVRSMKVTSSLGATITGDRSGATWNSSIYSTDGPDLTVEVTRRRQPDSGQTRFHSRSINKTVPMSIWAAIRSRSPSNWTMQPQAELRIDVVEEEQY